MKTTSSVVVSHFRFSFHPNYYLYSQYQIWISLVFVANINSSSCIIINLPRVLHCKFPTRLLIHLHAWWAVYGLQYSKKGVSGGRGMHIILVVPNFKCFDELAFSYFWSYFRSISFIMWQKWRLKTQGLEIIGCGLLTQLTGDHMQLPGYSDRDYAQ